MKTIETKAASVLADHPVDGAQAIAGVTHDGTHVWFVDGDRNDLVALDPASGEVARRLGGLGLTGGVTFDGEHLWGLARRTLLRIDRDSGEVLASIDVPEGCSGLGWAAGSLWLGSFGSREVLRIDPATGAVQRRIPSDRFVTGVTWCEGALWHGAWETAERTDAGGGELRRVDSESGEVLERLATPFRPSGVEHDGQGRFWCGEAAAGRLHTVSR
jgi:streptogramin lyase